MQLWQSIVLWMLVGSFGFALAAGSADAQEPARVRVAHLSPDAPVVDVLVDGAVGPTALRRPSRSGSSSP